MTDMPNFSRSKAFKPSTSPLRRATIYNDGPYGYWGDISNIVAKRILNAQPYGSYIIYNDSISNKPTYKLATVTKDNPTEVDITPIFTEVFGNSSISTPVGYYYIKQSRSRSPDVIKLTRQLACDNEGSIQKALIYDAVTAKRKKSMLENSNYYTSYRSEPLPGPSRFANMMCSNKDLYGRNYSPVRTKHIF